MKMVNDDCNDVPMESSLKARKYVAAHATAAQKVHYLNYTTSCNPSVISIILQTKTAHSYTMMLKSSAQLTKEWTSGTIREKSHHTLSNFGYYNSTTLQ